MRKFQCLLFVLTLYLPHYELTLGESAFYIFLKVNSPNNDIEKEFFEKFVATSRYELFPKWNVGKLRDENLIFGFFGRYLI